MSSVSAQAQVLKKAARNGCGFFSSRAAVRNRVNASRQLRQSMRRSPNPMDGDGKPKRSSCSAAQGKQMFSLQEEGSLEG